MTTYKAVMHSTNVELNSSHCTVTAALFKVMTVDHTDWRLTQSEVSGRAQLLAWQIHAMGIAMASHHAVQGFQLQWGSQPHQCCP